LFFTRLIPVTRNVIVTQVYELEEALRNVGVHSRLLYKPDAFTYLQIYQNNPWNIRPTLYISDYNAVAGKSLIRKN